MAFEPKIVQRAMARLERRREGRERKRWDLEQRLYQQEPKLRDLDRALRGTMVELTDLIAAGKPVQADGPEIAAIRQKNLDLQAQRAELLHALGYPPDALDRKPACPKCGDTGWNGTEMCSCLKQLCTQEQIKELTSLLNLTQFPSYPLKNLLLSGGTGLGKTFLSGCIAREVSERGFSVVYDTAISLFAAFESRKFSRDMEEGRQARDETRRYLHCDLLILDDLGSELTTQFTQSALYELINGRLVGGKRTVISSNLSMEEAAVRYSPQIASRLEGEYHLLHFFGEDIRLLRKKQL